MDHHLHSSSSSSLNVEEFYNLNAASSSSAIFSDELIVDRVGDDESGGGNVAAAADRDDDGQNLKITEFVMKHAKRNTSDNSDGGKSKIRRNRYSDTDLRKVLDMVDKIQDEAMARSGKKLPVKRIVDYFRTQTPYRTVSESMITRWTKRSMSPRTEQKKRGRKVNERFECDVYDDLVKTASSNALADLQHGVNMNAVVFDISKVSYDTVRMAAARVRSSGEYISDKSVANLQFTNKWVDGIKRRFGNRPAELLLSPYSGVGVGVGVPGVDHHHHHQQEMTSHHLLLQQQQQQQHQQQHQQLQQLQLQHSQDLLIHHHGQRTGQQQQQQQQQPNQNQLNLDPHQQLNLDQLPQLNQQLNLDQHHLSSHDPDAVMSESALIWTDIGGPHHKEEEEEMGIGNDSVYEDEPDESDL